LFDHPPDRGQGEEPLLEFWHLLGLTPEAADFIQRSNWPYPDERLDINDMYWHPFINPDVTLEEFVKKRGYPRAPADRWNPGWLVV